MFNIKSLIRHKLFKNSFIYAITNVINAAVPFLLLPVLTHYLTPADYGIIATFQILMAVAIGFVSLDMHGAIAVNYFKLNKQELKIYIGNIFFILLINFLLIFIIIYSIHIPIARLVHFPENWLTIVIIIAAFQAIATFALTLWQVEQKPLPYGLFQLSQTILNISLSLVFVVLLNLQWAGRLYGIIVPSILFGMIGFFIIIKRRYIQFNFNTKHIYDALKFSIPLLPHTISGLVILGTGRLFINSMVGVSETGIYTVGYQIGMIINLLATSFNRAWAPFLYEKLTQNDYASKVKIVKFTYLYFAGLIFMALALSFTTPWFLNIFVGRMFQSADKYVIWITLGCASNGMYYMVVNYIFYVKKTYILAWITFFAAVVNVIFCYYFIKINGSIGAAQAMTISSGVSFILTWVLSAKVYRMPWQVLNIQKPSQ